MIESSLLYSGLNGMDFVHDTYREYFACVMAAIEVNQDPLTFEQTYDKISRRDSLSKDFFLSGLEQGILSDELFGILHDNELRKLMRILDYDIVSNQKGLIVCIDGDQCYTNYDANKPVADILIYLEENYGLSTVGVEAAAGDMDFSLFRAFPDRDITREVATYFMRKGEITGPEYFGIFSPNDDIVYGVEDKDTYVAAAKAAGMVEDTEVKKDYKAKLHRHMHWANNMVRRCEEKGSLLSALFFSNTLDSWYKEMANKFRDKRYSSILVRHIGPRGLGKNYWKIARHEPLNAFDEMIRGTLK